ncbi:MAG: alpha/beta hydrolase-fold protein [bacterium]
MKKVLPFLALALLLACGESRVAEVEPYHVETPVEYAIRLPDDYDPEESYPVLVVLHGFDRSEAQATALRDASFFYLPDFILLALRAPFDAGAGYSWFRGAVDGDEEAATGRRRSARTAEDLVLAALGEIEEQYDIDADQRILLGLGQGASAAAWVALRNGDVFSGLALFGAADEALMAGAGPAGAREMEVFVAGPGDPPLRAERMFAGAGARTALHDLELPAVTATALRAMQNFFGLADEPAPEDNLGYDEDGEPVPGERLQPADWGDEPGAGGITQEAPDQASGQR